MSDFKMLLAETLIKIRARQNSRTHSSRLRAVEALEKLALKELVADEDLLQAVIDQRTYVLQSGGFGFWGKKGSNYLKEMEKLLRQTVRGLALLTAEAIQQKQNKNTDASRRIALNGFRLVINNKNETDKSVIDSAELQKSYVEKHGKFGFYGKSGSSFLTLINEFLAKAARLMPIKAVSTVIASKVPEAFNPKVAGSAPVAAPAVKSKFFQAPVSAPSSPENEEKSEFKKKLERLKQLDEEILELLSKDGLRVDFLSQWKYRIKQIANLAMTCTNMAFFDYYEEKMPLNIRNSRLLIEYKSIITDAKFIAAVNTKKSKADQREEWHRKTVMDAERAHIERMSQMGMDSAFNRR